MAAITNPPIIDIEASGFGDLSYPIEVGVALKDSSKFCALILPDPGWTHWDHEAEKVHGITRRMLELHGKPLRDVATQLNVLLGGKTLYSDGWGVDKPWLTTLFYAARLPMNFYVSPLELILSEFQMDHWHNTKHRVIEDMVKTRHRASYDAWAVQETYNRTLLAAIGQRRLSIPAA